VDCVADAVTELFNSFANDFEGYDDVFWTTATGMLTRIFERFSGESNGMSPLQQRVAIKLVDEVRNNMQGYYPAMMRVLVSVIGPYEEPGDSNPNSAFSFLRRAFYAELQRFSELWEKDPTMARSYLPKDVRYDKNRAAVVKIYRGGQERATELRALRIDPVPLRTVLRKTRGERQKA
jgi:hypothetical protein